jgi:CRISPR-associated endonuclease/helicase Cas3
VADEHLKSDLILALAFHDTGKAATGFQEMLKHSRKDWGHRRHEILSASFASCYKQSDEIIFAILTHHLQIPLALGDPTRARTLEFDEIPFENFEPPPIWLKMKDEWEKNQKEFAIVWAKICRAIGMSNSTTTNNLPLIPLSPKWLDRGGNGQRVLVRLEQRKRASQLRGLLIASDHLASAHRTPPPTIWFKDFEIISTARAFQRRCQSCKGSILLRAPTGSGKTEASLLWAQANQTRNGRLFYVLPNIASINAMRFRLIGIFGEANVGLLHSRATAAIYRLMESKDDKMSKLNQSRALELSQLARTIWFPIRVSTPHQILRHSLKGKGWEIMFSEFPNACFIFDEIHAYEPRIVGLTLASLNLFSQWKSKFCFMSATLPSFVKQLLEKAVPFTLIEPDPSQPSDSKILQRKRHQLEIKEGTIFDNWQDVLASIKDFESVLIVCNTVASSQKVYKSIPIQNKLLLHSRFNQKDRLRIEECLDQLTMPKVVVATQAIEVSLNVDFQRGFLEPAPIDAMIQRMGRVNRFGDRPPARVTVFRSEISKHSVYKNRDRVKTSVEELESLSKSISEDDLVAISDIIYESGYSSDEFEEFNEGLNHPDLKNFEDNLVAGASEDWVESAIEKADRNVELLPISLRKDYDDLISRGLWLEAHNLLVPVQVGSVAQLLKSGSADCSSDPWTTSCHYDEKFGLVLEKDSNSSII